MIPSTPNPNLPEFSAFLSNHQPSDSSMEMEGLDDFLDGDEVAKPLPTKYVHFIDSVVTQDGRVIKHMMNVKTLDVEANPEKLIVVAEERRIVILGSEEGKKQVKVDPIWEERFKHVEQINIEPTFRGSPAALRIFFSNQQKKHIFFG